MKYAAIYSPAALIEFIDTVKWYNVRSNITSENFVLAVKEKISDILQGPFSVPQ